MQPDILDQITNEYLAKFQAIFGAIFQTAQHLFFYFAVIQISVIALFYTLNRESLGDMASELIKKGLVIGIFLTAMNNAGTWFPLIINFFIDLGANSSGIQTLDPSSVAGQGLSISAGILRAIGVWGFFETPLGTLLGGVSCIAISLFYGLIAAELAITLIESYCLIAMSPMFMAFGANKFTQTYAMNYLNTAISLGVKLMVLYIVIGVGSTLGKDWSQIATTAANTRNFTGFLEILVAAMIYFLVAKRVPSFIAQIISGMSMNSGADAAAGAVMTAASVGATAIGHAKSANSAVQSAGSGAIGVGAFAAKTLMSSLMNSSKGSGGSESKNSGEAASNNMAGGMSENFKSNAQSQSKQAGASPKMSSKSNSLKK